MGVGGDGPGLSPEGSGPGSWLRYQAGGVGNPGSPGWVSWNNSLGRFWSHDFAERIVMDPDDTHVWLITRFATFREFSNLLPSGLYGDVSPSDEYRQLYRTIDGWELRFLDGTVQYFNSAGLWDRTEDKNQNTWEALSYAGDAITEVHLPDNRREVFTYSPTGRLASIQLVGTDNVSTLTWKYDWVGPDLYQIQRPDGTQWRFAYGRLDLPGYVTLMELVGTGSSQPKIIEGRWEYDTLGNVTKFWRGAALFSDPAAVDKWEMSYDDPSDPTQTTVTDPLGGESIYTYGRDTVSDKERVTNVQGACPVCGGPPNSSYDYDPAHPLRVAQQTDPSGTRTDFAYDSNGQLISKIEGANVVGHPHLPRITEWEYDADFPAFISRIEGPTEISGTPTRIVTMEYDNATGNLEQRTSSGNEATYLGGAFSLTTTYPTYNAAGGVETVDPPGYGTTDQTLFDYSLGNHGGMLVDRRIDPLVGVTQLTYDAFNRVSAVTDPNLVENQTTYDALGRKTSITNTGGSGTGDDRTTSYLYNNFGDLWCVKYPAGNAVQYVYDQDASNDVPDTAARRIVQERRGKAHASASTCLQIDSANPAERRFRYLDAAGHQVFEILQSGTGAEVWSARQKETHWIYSSMCHVDKVEELRASGVIETTEYSYDCNGNIENVWDQLHPKVSPSTTPSSTYAYDPLNRLVETSQPWVGPGGGVAVTSYGYDVQDHLVSVIDGEGTQTSYAYSDRGLMTSQDSEVSGTSSQKYNEHGELIEETDGRGIVVATVLDAADRRTSVDYPGTVLDLSFSYGSTPALFDVGRLTGITRNGATHSYTYNPFGELLSDGALSYPTRDKNGNPLEILYPGNLKATYTYDWMDRQKTVKTEEGANTAFIVMASPAAVYAPYGPVKSFRLDLGTDRDVTRTYDWRYRPLSLAVGASGALLNMSFVTDDVGNIVQQQRTMPGPTETRSFAYQDYQYYLTSATGPWAGSPLGWVYNKSGSRTRENRTGSPQHVYNYATNASATGTTSELTGLREPFAPQFRTYAWDNGGFLTSVTAGANVLDFLFDSAGQLGTVNRGKQSLVSTYDGRGFLKEALEVTTGGYVRPTYSSAGTLHSLERLPLTGGTVERINVLYFAGAPIALWKKVGTAAATTTRLVTDHLGTPIASIQQAGAALDWSGGFKPFGEDWQAGTAQDSLTKGIFLRLPGQWDDALFSNATLGADIYYNVHRWYEPQTGRYTRVDPLSVWSGGEYSYVWQRPTSFADPLGLVAVRQYFDSPGHHFGGGGKYSLAFGDLDTTGRCSCEVDGWKVRLSLEFHHKYFCAGDGACRIEQTHANIGSTFVYRYAQRWSQYEKESYGSKEECEYMADYLARDMEKHLFDDKDTTRELNQTQQDYEDTHHGFPCSLVPSLCAAY